MPTEVKQDEPEVKPEEVLIAPEPVVIPTEVKNDLPKIKPEKQKKGCFGENCTISGGGPSEESYRKNQIY